MSKARITRLLSLLLVAVMVCGLVPLTAFATETNDAFVSETHDVFSRTTTTIAPGVTQDICYAYAKDGKQMVYYVATADITRDDVVVQTSYLNQHENGVLGMEKLTNQIAYANQKYSNPDDAQYISEYYNVVAGVNASFYNMTTGQPMGITYIDGVSFGTNSYDNFFAILKDGKTAIIDYAKNIGNYVDENGESTIWQAVAGSQWLVRDGQDVTASATGSYNTDRHSRTCVGITADGKVVTMVLDGRQEPFSCGGSMHELAQIMLEAGCVAAINLDGGGSTTYAAREEGADTVKVINRPSDGSERSISAGLMIASTTIPSNTFDHVTMKVADEYVTPGTSTEITVAGVSPAGTAADIPADIDYRVTNGTFADGVLTAGAAGDVVLTAVYHGAEVGSVTIHAVIPEKLAFVSTNMTVPFGKTVAMNVTAAYGLNAVKFKADDLEFTLENAGVGTIEGLNFTAGDGSVTRSVVTAVFNGTDVTAAAEIVLGKGSEVLWDFEDANVSEFYRTAAPSYNYLITPGDCSLATAENGKVHSGKYALKFNADFSVATESGYMNARLGVENETGERIDLKDATRIGMWIYFPIEAKSLNGRIFLVKVTERNEDGTIKSVSSSYTTATLIDDGGDWNCGFTNEYDEPGWHYVYFNLSGGDWCIPANWIMLDIYINDRDGSGHGYNHFEHKSQNSNVIMYLDDITVDYSSAVDDRDAPVFSGIRWADPKMSDAVSFQRGTVAQTTENTISFSASVADKAKDNATGLDESTAKIFVDGVEAACTIKDGVMSVQDCVLADGVHTVKFAISDKQGNYASAIRQINVQAGSGKPTIMLKPHDAALNNILLGSVYYMDLVATDMEKVQSVTADIDLNNMSRWELDHMVAADGFEASYVISDLDENIATITVTRIGGVETAGEGMLVSMPVRTWELPAIVADGTRNNVWMYPEYRKGNEVWPIDISASVVRGEVAFTDGTNDTFTGAKVQVDTEAHYWTNETKPADYAAWNGGHDHRAETKQYYAESATNHVDAVALADKAATCTEDGYTGRTYCEVCDSVVDWGTTVPAAGHTYDFVDGVLKCTVCGELFNGEWTDGKLYADGQIVSNAWVGDSYYVDGEKLTGIQLIDGYYYDFGEDGVCSGKVKYTGFLVDGKGKRYSVDGVLRIGWTLIGEDNYYFMGNHYAATGKASLGSPLIIYTFDENGVLMAGDWYDDGVGMRYYWAGVAYKHGFYEIDGSTYFFDANMHIVKGIQAVALTHGDTPVYYWFDEDTGALQAKFEGDGLKIYGNNVHIVYLDNGVPQYAGLVQDAEGSYYYINSRKEAVKGCTYSIGASKTNDLLPAGVYTFDADGKMIDPPVQPEEPETKNGLVTDEDGEIRYYVDGVAQYAGLVQDAEGNYYYINSTRKAVKSCTYGIGEAKTNGLLPAGTYNFGADGKMIDPPTVNPDPDPEVKQGLVTDEDGEIRYYVDGVAQYAGLVQDAEGNYYYINSTRKAVKSCTYGIGEAKTNGLLPAGTYNFGADGKMIDPPTVDPNPEVKQGLVTDEDGEIRYYVDGVAQYAGLVRDAEGNYYYINSTRKAVKSCTYGIGEAKTNGLLPAGIYNFDADGKMIDPPGV